MWLPVWSNGNGVHIIKTTLGLFRSFSPRLGTESHICDPCETATSITLGNKNKWTFFLLKVFFPLSHKFIIHLSYRRVQLCMQALQKEQIKVELLLSLSEPVKRHTAHFQMIFYVLYKVTSTASKCKDVQQTISAYIKCQDVQHTISA